MLRFLLKYVSGNVWWHLSNLSSLFCLVKIHGKSVQLVSLVSVKSFDMQWIISKVHSFGNRGLEDKYLVFIR